jgi:hypothetical protein
MNVNCILNWELSLLDPLTRSRRYPELMAGDMDSRAVNSCNSTVRKKKARKDLTYEDLVSAVFYVNRNVK